MSYQQTLGLCMANLFLNTLRADCINRDRLWWKTFTVIPTTPLDAQVRRQGGHSSKGGRKRESYNLLPEFIERSFKKKQVCKSWAYSVPPSSPVLAYNIRGSLSHPYALPQRTYAIVAWLILHDCFKYMTKSRDKWYLDTVFMVLKRQETKIIIKLIQL